MKRAMKVGIPTLAAIEDAWQRQATAAAIAAARNIVRENVIPSLTPIERLSDVEWGWIVASVLFGWIATRAEQATAEGFDIETTIRSTGVNPDPWDGGSVIGALPQLAELSDIDWAAPLGEWPRETVVRFLLEATKLINKAMAVRDVSNRSITRPESVADLCV
jgi:hypothetical protein